MRQIKLLSKILFGVLLFILVLSQLSDGHIYNEVQSFSLDLPENLIQQELPVLKGDVKTIDPANDWDEYIELITMNEEAKAWLKRVWRCESSGNEFAKNPISPASGLMQFFPSTFKAYGGKDIWDGKEQLRVALIMYEIGEQHQWVCK